MPLLHSRHVRIARRLLSRRSNELTLLKPTTLEVAAPKSAGTGVLPPPTTPPARRLLVMVCALAAAPAGIQDSQCPGHRTCSDERNNVSSHIALLITSYPRMPA